MEYFKKFYSLVGIFSILSDLIQLWKVIISKNINEFQPTTWLLFLIVNLTGFIFANKIYDFNTILAFMGPSVIDIILVLYTYYKRNELNLLISTIFGLIVFGFIYFNVIYFHHHLINEYSYYFGIFPSIILPLSIILQLWKIISKGACYGVSKITWILQLLSYMYDNIV